MRLNVVGWSALLGLCLMAGAAGVAVMAATGFPGPSGAACALVPLVAVFLVDRRRWARMRTGYGWGGSVEDVARVVALLQARGVHAQVLPDDFAEERFELERPHPHGPTVATASLEYFNGDADVVRDVLREKGIHLPDLP